MWAHMWAHTDPQLWAHMWAHTVPHVGPHAHVGPQLWAHSCGPTAVGPQLWAHNCGPWAHMWAHTGPQMWAHRCGPTGVGPQLVGPHVGPHGQFSSKQGYLYGKLPLCLSWSPHVSSAPTPAAQEENLMFLLHKQQQLSSKTSCFCYTNTSSLLAKPHVSNAPTPAV